MSAPLLAADIIFAQRLLKLERMYSGDIDGLWGPLSERAYREFEAASAAIIRQFERFDQRSETQIASLCLAGQKAARKTLLLLADHGFSAQVLSGTRSYYEQNQLFKIGRYGDTLEWGGFWPKKRQDWPEWHLLKLLRVAVLSNVFTCLRPWFHQSWIGFWSSFHSSWLDPAWTVAHALFGNQHK